MWKEGRTERQMDTHYEVKALFTTYANALKDVYTRKCVIILCEFVVPEKMWTH